MLIVARAEVVVHRERLAVQRGRVERGVRARVQRDPTQRLARRAVARHVLRRRHRHRVDRLHAVGREVLVGPRDPPGGRAGDLTPFGQLAVARLPHGAEAHDVPAQPGRDREHRRDQRAGRARRLVPAVVPRGPDAERGLDRRHAAFRVAAFRGGGRVGGEAVDVVHREAGIVDRAPDRLDGERDRRDHELAADTRHADARERDAVLELLGARHRAYRADACRARRARRATPRAGRRWVRRAEPTRRRRARTRRAHACRPRPRRARTPRCWS